MSEQEPTAGERGRSIEFVVAPDRVLMEVGAIIVPTGRFTETATPTKHRYMRFVFDFTDAPTAVIRELAVMVGSVTDPALPGGQMYFEPHKIIANPLVQMSYKSCCESCSAIVGC